MVLLTREQVVGLYINYFEFYWLIDLKMHIFWVRGLFLVTLI